MPEPLRHISAPPPPPDFRDFPQPMASNNFRDQKSFPVMMFNGGGPQFSDQSRPMVHPPPFYRPHQQNQQSHSQQQNFQQQQELYLHLAPPLPQNSGIHPPPPHNMAFQAGNSNQDSHLHNEANDYASSLGLNIQSINSAPLISSFTA